jgi:hypothetical protein
MRSQRYSGLPQRWPSGPRSSGGTPATTVGWPASSSQYRSGRVQQSTLSWAMKIGRSPTRATPRVLAWAFNAANWVSKHHCTKRQKPISARCCPAGRQQGGRVTLAQRGGPGPPGLARVRHAQRHEERVVVQPVGLATAPAGQSQALGRPWPGLRSRRRLRAGAAAASGRHGRSRCVQGRSRLLASQARTASRVQPAAPAPPAWAAGKGRQAHVGRIARPHRVDGQQLPQRLSGGVQPVDHAVCIRPEVTRAVRPRQRGDVQQDAGAARGQFHARRSRVRGRFDNVVMLHRGLAGSALSI